MLAMLILSSFFKSLPKLQLNMASILLLILFFLLYHQNITEFMQHLILQTSLLADINQTVCSIYRG